MAQTFETSFVTLGLGTGLTNKSYVFRAFENTTFVAQDTVSATTASNGVFTIGEGVITIPENKTITKVELRSNDGNTIYWTVDGLNFVYPVQGTLTLDLDITLTGASEFDTQGLDFILNNGLNNESLAIVVRDSSGNPIGNSGLDKTWGTASNGAIDIANSPINIGIGGATAASLEASVLGTPLFEVTGLNITAETLIINSLELQMGL